MDHVRQNYSIIRNFYYCAANVTVIPDGEFATPAIHKRVKRWASGETLPTKASLLEMTRLMPEAMQLIARSSNKRDSPYRPHMASYVNFRPLKDSVFMFEEPYFPFLVCHIEHLGMLLFEDPKIKVPSDILFPEPYRTVFLHWRSLDDEQRKLSVEDEYRLRVESLLLILAVREAGNDPRNRVILGTFKRLSENRRTSQESCKAAFFRLKKCGYIIWKELARREWFRKQPANNPKTDDLQHCYDRGKFYSRLKQPSFDRVFLSEVFGVYYDRVLERPYDAEERETVVDFLLLTFFQIATLDSLFSKRPQKVDRLSDQEVVGRLEAYIDFALASKKSPLLTPEIVAAVDEYWKKQFKG